MNRNVFIGGIVAILAIIGLVFFFSQNNDEPAPTTNTQASNTADTGENLSSNSGQATESQAVIKYTDNGFDPQTITVESGTKVTVQNASSNPLQFDSDPHPEHTEDPELNIGRINPGESKTITVTTKGSHGYHNHLNSGDTGTIIVN